MNTLIQFSPGYLVRLFRRFMPMVFLCLFVTQSFAQSPSELSLKAQYVLNVAKFVSWPQTSRESLHLCLLGNDEIESALKKLTGSKVGGRLLQFTQYRNQKLVDDCDILFISESEKRITTAVVKRLTGKPILTISDQKKFVDNSGMVQLYRQGSRLRFDIGVDAAAAANLSISSKLLKLAGNKPGQGGANSDNPS